MKQSRSFEEVKKLSGGRIKKLALLKCHTCRYFDKKRDFCGCFSMPIKKKYQNGCSAYAEI